MEPLLEIEKMGSLGHDLMSWVFADPGARRGRHPGGDEGLGLADGEVFVNDSSQAATGSRRRRGPEERGRGPE